MKVTLLGIPQRPYNVQAAANLVPGFFGIDWQTLSTNAADANGLSEFLDGTVTNTPTRFYRTRSP